MRRRLWLIGLACATAVFAAWRLVSMSSEQQWRRWRDGVQREAETTERTGHPWAGVYLAKQPKEYSIGKTLCLAPSGDFYGASYSGFRTELLFRARGRAETAGNELSLTISDWQGSIGSKENHLAGGYRVVKWGDVRCLIRPGEERRLLDCAIKTCEDYVPLCTRGSIHGEPELPKDVKEAVHQDFNRPFKVVAVSDAKKGEWDYLYFHVEIAAGQAQGLARGERLYWVGDDHSVDVWKVNRDSATGVITTIYKNTTWRPSLRPGMTLRRQAPTFKPRPT